MTKNFVLQTLIAQFEVVSWYRGQNSPSYEVDFPIQRENDIFPVEVRNVPLFMADYIERLSGLALKQRQS